MLHFELILFNESFRSINKLMTLKLLHKIKHCHMINHVVAVLFLDFYQATLPSVMFLIYIHIEYSYIYQLDCYSKVPQNGMY